jgi:hypothetical protein
MEQAIVPGIKGLLVSDMRCHALQTGLQQLDNADLTRLRDHMDQALPLALDTFNYDRRTGAWCPLAVGLGVDKHVDSTGLTNDMAKAIIIAVGERKYGSFSLNPISGISGEFFRSNRYADLQGLVRYMLTARGVTV